MRKLYQFALLFLVIIQLGCGKKDVEYCWQKMDVYGNELETICDKTEAEMKAANPDSCSYYKLGGEKSCYLINNFLYRDITAAKLELLQSCFGVSRNVIKVSCDYCGKWYHRQKTMYKPTGAITFSSVRVEILCGDTAKTLFQGRQVVIKETFDSLIVRQFSSDGANW